MKKFAVDVAVRQFSKRGEDICGDAWKVSHLPDSTIIVLSDGLGSGVKANILANLTVEIASGLFKGDLSQREIVETLIDTLPVCKVRNIAYSTFSIARIYDTGQVTLVGYDCPSAVFRRNGLGSQWPAYTEHEICGKTIRESYFRMKPDESLVFFTDGIVNAGIGQGLALGWQEEGILDYLKGQGTRPGTPEEQAEKLSGQALGYWSGSPGDDGTVVVARYRKASKVSIITGPPSDRTLVDRMMRDFTSREGGKVVCGGTTAHLVAQFLGHELQMDERYLDSDLPPTALLNEVDLVTEGILTLSRAAEYLTKGRPENTQDGATALLDCIDQADGITFLVGTARNPAHQNTGLPASIFLRKTVVENLAGELQRRGKETELVYY